MTGFADSLKPIAYQMLSCTQQTKTWTQKNWLIHVNSISFSPLLQYKKLLNYHAASLSQTSSISAFLRSPKIPSPVFPLSNEKTTTTKRPVLLLKLHQSRKVHAIICFKAREVYTPEAACWFKLGDSHNSRKMEHFRGY